MGRKNKKYPDLDPKSNTKVRQELIDYDYLSKLSEEEKEWLNRFTKEYVSASFDKTENNRYSAKNLHKGSKKRRECYTRNNNRKADLFSVVKSNDMLKDEKSGQAIVEDQSVRSASAVEDFIITLIDENHRAQRKYRLKRKF